MEDELFPISAKVTTGECLRYVTACWSCLWSRRHGRLEAIMFVNTVVHSAAGVCPARPTGACES